MTPNKITFLGTGTSVGVPMIGCGCEVCRSTHIRDYRLRTSALIQYLGRNILVDIGPDFRQQMLTHHISHIDAVLLTHPHRDHIAGFDDIRALNFVHHREIPIYANAYTWDSLTKQFYYAFQPSDYASMPKANYHEIDTQIFQIQDIPIMPIQLRHGSMPCLGFRIGNVAYITDASWIEPSEYDKLKDLDILVLNALRKYHHPSHFTLDEAIAEVNKIKPQRAYFTHISHHMGFHEEVSGELPDNVHLAYDGLTLEF